MKPTSGLAAFVITFRRSGALRSTLESLAGQSLPPSRILVVDNGRSTETKQVVRAFASCGATYHDPGDNLGPAGAAAYGLETLVGEGWETIYWGDDDDPPRGSDTLERLTALASDGAVARLAAVGAFGARWDWSRGRYVRLADEELAGPVEVDVIGGNAQLLLRAEAVRAAGLPNPALFFGLEEIEYCLRLRRAGYRLAVDGDLMREYRRDSGRLGLPSSPRRSLVPRSRVAPWRQYYSTRNYIHLMRCQFGRPNLARREAFRALWRAAASWMRGFAFGRDFAGLQLRAVIDGYRGKLGRTVTPPGPDPEARNRFPAR